MNIRRLIRSLFVGIWRAAEGVRKILHLVFLLLVVGILIAGVATQDQPRVPEQAALMVAPEGRLVEQLSGGVLERALAEAQGVNVGETLLKDVVDAIRAAADDDRIEALVLDPTGLTGGGLSKLQELADEIVRFKESEKPVIAIGDYFTRDQYYLAAHADEIYMNPLGLIWMSGYSRFLTYYKSAIDNLYIDYHVWTVGEYKSFVEPVSRDDMSPEDRESSEVFLGALWDAYQADVTAARQLPGDALQRFADEAVELLVAADGDSARMALDYGLVDELLTRDQIRQRLDELVGDPEDDDYETVGTSEYLAAASGSEENSDADDTIAVIVASGSILDGSQPPGTIGGDSTAATIRRATEDDDVKALVLRVDSGGGSAFASEIIQRELQVFRESGRPVVASMSSVAASGGYWISMGADEIWASPVTITGSIGVGATIPTFSRSLDRIGVHVDGLGTTRLSGQDNLMRDLGDEFSAMVQHGIERVYADFIANIAEYRDKSVEDVDMVARGRVWIASDAQAFGLVDELGNLEDAIASAAMLAELPEDEYRVQYYTRELTIAEQIALELIRMASPVTRAMNLRPVLPESLQTLLDIAAEPFRMVDHLNDPQGIYAYCFCDIR